MKINRINSTGFIHAISQDSASIIIFRPKGADYDKKVANIEKLASNLESSLPRIYFFEYITNESPENEYLAETLEISNGLSAVLYKNGCFKRYQTAPIDSNGLRKIWAASKDKASSGSSEPRERQKSSEYITMEDI